jgi:hypothetical protein
MKRHISTFKKWCQVNRDAILKQDRSLLVEPYIIYSEAVNINMASIFNSMEPDEEKVVWSHLLGISALVSGDNEAAVLYRQNAEAPAPDAGGLPPALSEMMAGIMGGGGKDNPMGELFGTILSGVTKQLESGNLDVEGLVGGLTGNLSSQVDGDPDKENAMEGLQDFMKSLTGGGEGGSENPLAGLMGGLMKTMEGSDDGSGKGPDLGALLGALGGGGIDGMLGDLAGNMAAPSEEGCEATDSGTVNTGVPEPVPPMISSMVSMMAGAVPTSVPMGASPDFSNKE